MSYHIDMMIIYDESYIQNSRDRDYAIYEKKFENLTKETIFTHMHFHYDFEILYVVEGNAQMQVAGNEFIIGPHSIVLINPYEPHYGKIVSEEFHYICIDFDLALLNLPHEKSIMDGCLCYMNHIKEGEKNLRYLLECYEAIKNGGEHWKMRATGNLLLLFSCFGRYVHETAQSKDHLFVKRTLELMQENFSQQINTKVIAKQFSYNESYFCRKFQKIFHCSFSEYLKNYRIAQAKKMLYHKSVTAVAMDTGFSSIYYFSRIFKESVGMSPSEYKKICT